MKSSIKIIKRTQLEESKCSKTFEAEKSVEQKTRELVSTVKSWITEFQERKRTQAHSFSNLPVIGIVPSEQDS
jgi:hypothetical protein